MPVDRCVCFDVTFAELHRYAQTHQCDLDGLRQRFNCTRGCAMCLPYIRAMLETGQTVFDHLPSVKPATPPPTPDL